jgi:hypothetical protein
MDKRINDLADVLQWLTVRQATKSPAALAEEVDSLRLIVQQMATSLALHEVQIQKLRAAQAVNSLRES